MVRVLIFLLGLVILALGIAWFADRPGEIVVNWQGYRIVTSFSVGLAFLCIIAALLMVAWGFFRNLTGLPSFISTANKRRKQTKGYAALSRGMIAAGVGDARLAARAANEARRHLPKEPLALLLKAQAAQLAGQKEEAEAVFKEMVRRPDMRLLGLRGLHAEAHRKGDAEGAQHLAHAAYELTPLPWSAKAVFDHRAKQRDWQSALSTLEKSIAAKLIDKKKGDRQRAVLETAIAQEKALQAPEEALQYARAALKRIPDFVPAVVVTARLLSRKGEIGKAAKLIESAWARVQHPELSAVYINLRPGDSNTDRLVRAERLVRIAPNSPESRMALTGAALDAKNFALARKTMQPLIETRETADGQETAGPTVRACLLMAELEDAEHGAVGEVRQWLTRSSRAPRDPTWVADGYTSEHWLPASPVTGEIDAFVWQRPAEQLATDIDPNHDYVPLGRPPLVIDQPVAFNETEKQEDPAAGRSFKENTVSTYPVSAA